MGDPLEVSDIYQEVKWVFRDSVLSKADVIQATRDAVCIFKELQCLTPRGRFSLDPPIKQGQTRYHFLILLFSKEEDLSLSLNMTEWRSVMGGSLVRTCQVPSMRWSVG
ncbi:FACT complex subunit SSRP1-like isoform X2 [Oncorhynchus masou masou]|uniref:FACT complex subunit SSRP1-like isoform X2 n=1 Tax=Oncorhynchus masou masou TaxID=90313 RepID=UPI0031834B42